jgi:hypothetical protein
MKDLFGKPMPLAISLFSLLWKTRIFMNGLLIVHLIYEHLTQLIFINYYLFKQTWKIYYFLELLKVLAALLTLLNPSRNGLVIHEVLYILDHPTSILSLRQLTRNNVSIP